MHTQAHICVVRHRMKSLLLGGFPLCDFGVGSVSGWFSQKVRFAAHHLRGLTVWSRFGCMALLARPDRVVALWVLEGILRGLTGRSRFGCLALFARPDRAVALWALSVVCAA